MRCVIATYLRQQKEHVGAQTRRIRDPTVFDFDYVPDQPLLRAEAETLVQELLRFDLTGMPIEPTDRSPHCLAPGRPSAS